LRRKPVQTFEEYLKENTARGNTGRVEVINDDHGVSLIVRSAYKRQVFDIKGNLVEPSAPTVPPARIDEYGYTLP
jgi:hypothetical protein